MSVQFKKRAVKTTSKKQSNSDSDEDSNEDQETVLNASKKSRIDPSTSKLVSGSTASTAIGSVVYESTREIVPQSYAGDATHSTEIDTSADRDTRAILERNIKLSQASDGANGVKLYQGQHAYKSLIPKTLDQVSSNKVSGTQGPIRAPSFLRATCRFDYAPDICKDYKETGFCGWGDNCKFLHDRGDYKSGWQMEKEWDAKQAKKKKLLEEKLLNNFMTSTSTSASSGSRNNIDDDDDEGRNEFNEILNQQEDEAAMHSKIDQIANSNGDEEEENYEIPDAELDGTESIPFACFLCREPFQISKNPIITLCQHYFCSDCIIGHEKKTKTSKCPICDKQMYGVFNRPVKLLKKLNKNEISSSSSSISSKLKPRSTFVFVDENTKSEDVIDSNPNNM